MEEITTSENNKLTIALKATGLNEEEQKSLLVKFEECFAIAEEWKKKADALVITSITQKQEMKLAGEGRKFLKSKRVDVEKTRVALKSEYLKKGRAIDAIANIFEELITPIEENLYAKEKYAEIIEAQQKEQLKKERLEKLSPYSSVSGAYALDTMSEEDFQKLFDELKSAYEFRVEKERKDKLRDDRLAELSKYNYELSDSFNLADISEETYQDLLGGVKAAFDERELRQKEIEAENKRLREINDAKEKELEDQRKANDKIQADLKAKQDEEKKRIEDQKKKEEDDRKAEELAEKRKKALPDKNKLLELANTLDDTELPEVVSEEAQKIISDVKTLLTKVTAHIRTKSELL